MMRAVIVDETCHFLSERVKNSEKKNRNVFFLEQLIMPTHNKKNGVKTRNTKKKNPLHFPEQSDEDLRHQGTERETISSGKYNAHKM